MTNSLHRLKSLLLMLLACSAAVPQESTAPQSVNEEFGKLLMSFEQNPSRSAGDVKFTARGNGYSVFLAGAEAVLLLDKGKADVVRMRLEGGNRSCAVSGEEKLPGTANYIIGNDPAKWRSNLPTYAKVRYSGVYPGIDLIYYGNQRQLEYDFLVAPGADPARIGVRFQGAKNVVLQANGDLLVKAGDGEVVFQKPVLYQSDADGERRSIEGRFSVGHNNRVGFSVGSYDRGKPLVIDPVLGYSTFLGGPGGNAAWGIALDSSGAAYMTGTTHSGFPVTAGAFETVQPSNTAAFVSKLNPSGTALAYSTYLGGTEDVNSPSANSNAAFGVAVDAAGSAYVTGSTTATNFPVTSGALIQTNTSPTFYGVASPMAFVTKLNPSGTGLAYSTYLGPLTSHGTFNGFEGYAIAVDSSGDAYVTGWASSGLATTLGSFQPTDPDGAQVDPFVWKLNPTGTGLVYGTYITGTNNWGTGNAIAIDAQGNAYIAGATAASDFPVTANAVQSVNNDVQGCTSYCSTNAFITKLNASGSALVYSTYLGGSGGASRWADVPTAFEGNGGYTWDGAASIAVDSFGSAYVAGFVFSTDFPITPGAFQSTNYAAAQDGFSTFVAKFNPSGSALEYSTFIGGSGVLGDGDAPAGIAVDAGGYAYLTGIVHSPDFPLSPKAFQTSQNFGYGIGKTAYVAKLNPTGSGLSYSTYLASTSYINPGLDGGTGIALDSNANAYVTGYTTAGSFPVTAGVFQSTLANGNPGNAFVSKFHLGTANGTFYHSATSVTVSSPRQVGKNVTFIAQVVSTEGNGTPTGSVVFSATHQGAVPYATAKLNANGEAAYTTTYESTGNYTVYATYSGDADFTANSAGAATVTIIGPPAAISVVSGSGQSTVYGSSFPEPLVVSVTDSDGNLLPNQKVNFSGAGLNFSAVAVLTDANGQASVTATPNRAATLSASATVSGASTPAVFNLTANKAPLTVTAVNVTVPYEQPIPSLTYTITGFVNGDTPAVVEGTPSETTTATQGSSPGSYPIDISRGTLGAANYIFNFVDGTLTITAN